MSIIDLKGNTLESDSKREHDPQRVMALRNNLAKLMHELQQGWLNDNGEDPTGASQPNAEAIDSHYVKRWLDQCATVMNGREPIDVDPEAMSKWIAARREAKRANEELQMPLHKVLDLEPHGFALVGTYPCGALWVSSECAVVMTAGGMVEVYVRPREANYSEWVCTFANATLGSTPLLQAPDYTLGELRKLLAALRRERPAKPQEEDLETLRQWMNAEYPQS